MLKKLNRYKKGKIFVISAPSGAGKTSLVTAIRIRFPALEQSISCTTRTPRPGEINGKDYFFLEKNDFDAKIEKNYFVEWAEVYGNKYGTPKHWIAERIDEGKNVICNIDVQGALNIKRLFPKHSVLIFIIPPSIEELVRRLRGRATDDDTVIQKRLENARHEITFFKHYRYIVVNDHFETAEQMLEKIITVETEATTARNITTLTRLLG